MTKQTESVVGEAHLTVNESVVGEAHPSFKRSKNMKAAKCLTLTLAAVLLVQQGASGQTCPPDGPPVPVGTAFTYQGLLTCTSGGGAQPKLVTATCNLTFDLYDCQTDGNLIATAQSVRDLNDPNKTLCAPGPKCPVTVIDGHFAVQLEFGNVYDGNARFLETTVECPTPCQPGQATLEPRQELTPVPYALFAQKGTGPVDDKDWSGSGSGTMWTTNLKDNVGIGTDAPIGKLDVVGNTVGNVFVYNNAKPGRTYEIRAGQRQEIYNNNDFVHFSGSNVQFVLNSNVFGGAGNDEFFISVGSTAPADIKFLLEGTSGNVGIGTTTPLAARLNVDKDIPVNGNSAVRVTFSNAAPEIGTRGISVESDPPLNQKGSQIGVIANTSKTGGPDPQRGAAQGSLAHVKGAFSNGVMIGVSGTSTPNTLSTFGGHESFGVGGRFVVSPPDPLVLVAPLDGNFWIGGSYNEVDGIFNQAPPPDKGAIAAVIGVDNNTGNAQSFAGYFDGKVLVTDLPTGGIDLVSADAAGILHRNPGGIRLGREIQGSRDSITASSGTINFDDEDLVTKGSIFVTGLEGPPFYKDRTYEIRAGQRQEIYNTNDFVHFSGSNVQFVLNSNVLGGAGNDEFFISVGSTDPADIRFILEGTTGNVGIGTPTPGAKLDVNGNVCVSGTIRATGLITESVSCPSDRRLKDHIEPITRALDKVSRLRGVSFQWRRDEFPKMNFRDGQQIGLIAQEVAEVLPEVVVTDPDGYKGIQYGKLVAVLVEAIKEQQQIINSTRSELGDLKQRLAAVERAVGVEEKPQRANSAGLGGTLTATALALAALIGFMMHAHSRRGGVR